jgi:hypothetical protein
MRKGCALVSGMAFGPKRSRRRRASLLVRPIGEATLASARPPAVETLSSTAGIGMDVIQSEFVQQRQAPCCSPDVG